MDANKLEKLKEIGFNLKPTCMLCVAGEFPNNDWGTCAINSYKHLKHTDELRKMSIHKSGSCSRFLLDERKEEELESFKQFF